MRIITQFVNPVSKEKMLHNLRNVKKIIPRLRQYSFEVTNKKYLMKDDDGNVVAEFRYFIEEEFHVIHFDNFKGENHEEIEKMLTFNFPEKVRRKCFVYNLGKKWKMYFSLSEWFLIDKIGVFKIGRDREKLMEIESYRIPKEVKER